MKRLSIIFACLILLCGCGKKKEEEKKETPKKEVTKEVVKSKLETSNTRPFAIMVNNLREARPQAGLNEAYIVYELPVEYGITRLMALYKDKTTSKIGSCRSARPYYLDYALENDAIYVHFGGSDAAYNQIKDIGINDIDGNMAANKYFYRDTTLGRAFEHTAFTTSDNIKNAINDYGYVKTTEKRLLKYQVKEVSYNDSIDCNSIKIPFSAYQTTTFNYNSETKLYYRSNNVTGDANDLVTGEANTTKNIIVYGLNITYGDHGYANVSNIGSGDGYYISNGKATPITWSKDTKGNKTQYKTKDGKDLIVNDGNTYIEIYPSNYSNAKIG